MTPSHQDRPTAAGLLSFIRHPTSLLRELVETQIDSLSPEALAEEVALIRSLYDKYRLALRLENPGPRRAEALHRMIDEAQATRGPAPVTCRRGCGGCCHVEVEVTRDEALLLAEIVRGGTEIDRGRLRVQAARPRLSKEWERFFAPENRCVFLGEDAACRIYKDRPSMCRRLLVTTPAEACTTPGASVEPLRILLVEVLLSAAVEVDEGQHASLPSLLEQELKKDDGAPAVPPHNAGGFPSAAPARRASM